LVRQVKVGAAIRRREEYGFAVGSTLRDVVGEVGLDAAGVARHAAYPVAGGRRYSLQMSRGICGVRWFRG
jgi:hypothetical protein